MSRLAPALAAVAAVALLTGCGSATTPAATATAASSASPTSPYGAAPSVDPPGPTDTVLTLRGGSRGTVSYTLAQLEALGGSSLTIDEPFAKERETFTVVPLARLLDEAGITDAACINTIALNDYRYRNQAGAFTGSQAAIATQLSGSPIPFDRGGPIRIVFPDGTPMAGVLDAWNWSLSDIQVEPVSPCSTQSP